MNDYENLKLCGIQLDIAWENPEQNFKNIESILKEEIGADLVVLPETFSTGFSIKRSLAQKMQGKTIEWMINTAKKFETALMGSVIIEENNQVFNRMILVEKDGKTQHYDKWHLFNYGSEGKHFTSGNEIKIFDLNGWKIKPIICYDLRFPVTIRNVENYDLLVCVANWPDTRIEAWNTLLKARAIENQAYVMGVNRVGTDGSKLNYCGNSAIIDPMGKNIEIEKKGTVFYAEIEKEKIQKIRKSFPFLADRDQFHLE